MQQARKRSVLAVPGAVCLAAGLSLVVGCQAALSGSAIRGAPVRADNPASLQASQQLMVKLKNASRSCNASDIAALAAATGEALLFLRPMSGDACVVSHAAKNDTLLRSGLERLKSHHAVEWAEIDAILKPA